LRLCLSLCIFTRVALCHLHPFGTTPSPPLTSFGVLVEGWGEWTWDPTCLRDPQKSADERTV
jgi:hypothetical protein